MPRNPRDKDVFPILTIRNLTNAPLVIQIPSRRLKRIVLAANGKEGDSKDVRGIDFGDRRVRRTLRGLVRNSKISVQLKQSLADYLSAT